MGFKSIFVLRGYLYSMYPSKIITITPGRRSGQPCIRNLRITVGDIMGYLASGMSKEEIIDDFPELTMTDIQATLEYAANQLNKTVSVSSS